MYTIKEKSYSSNMFTEHMSLLHRYYLDRTLRERITIRDLTAIYHDTLQVEMGDKSKEDIKQSCIIEYTDENMLKFISAEDFQTCMQGIEKYNKDLKGHDLTQPEIEAILTFNNNLRQLEKMLLRDGKVIYDHLVAQGWKAKCEVFEKDFEMEAKIDFLLKEDDPAFDDGSDNIVSTAIEICFKLLVEQSCKQGKDYHGIGDDLDHNDARGFSKHPVYAVKHCYLFHELISHNHVPLKFIPRIGDIWVDYVVQQQKMIRKLTCIHSHLD